MAARDLVAVDESDELWGAVESQESIEELVGLNVSFGAVLLFAASEVSQAHRKIAMVLCL